ncbi:MAG TPA: amino acid adenylation domain-containing protein, partial [Longimicrobium sp.]|nr:amino acid adenylation domain-containing protein [Longimicrobium sp.]
RRLSELELLGAAERRQLLAEWSGAGAQGAPAGCVHGLFAEWVARTPGAVALRFADEEVTYAELEERANRLARLLVRRGIVLESRVGLCLERSAELVVAMLAVLKAGAAYVPLDPAYPAERLALMAEDAGLAALLTREHLRDALAGLAGGTLCLDTLAGELAATPAEPLRVEVPAEALAYVIYTSGSTGRPKGVAVPHRGVVRLVRETDFAQLEASDRVVQVSNMSFDAATFEVWGALLNGSCLVGAEREVVLSPERLADFLRREGVTATFLTSALFNQTVRAVPGAFATMRHVLVGGDAVDPTAMRAALEAGGPERLLNAYGPTENTTFSAWHRVEAVEAGAATVPIGRAVAISTLYVLDAALNPAPVGVAGELYVGGAGVARGYLGRPELTAEKFVPDAFGPAGARLYRTGDRVRWNTAGAIEFLGRVDHQVKIRGFRIEPGEVAAVLLEHPAVRDALVVVREDGPGERRLVAYAAAEAPTAELREHLRGRLPEYMVPSAFVVLEVLPLTPNGKVDRSALPEPEAGSGAGAYVAPRGAVEELLAEIFAGVLEQERVGVEDDFFALGGHSLLATRVVSRVREVLGVELPLRALFEAPTVAGLAARADQALREGSGLAAPPLVPVPRDRPLPLSFAQQRLWFIDRLEPGSAAYNMPFPLRLRGVLDVRALEQALEELVRRHETLRTVFARVDGEPVQVIREPAPVALEVTDLRDLPEEEREGEALRVVAEEAAGPFDLEAGPLLRSCLLRLGDEEWVLLFTLHHIVSDGWSLGVLVREVCELYAAFREGREPALPELSVQYADFAAWQRVWLTGEVLERQLGWWREALSGAPPLLEIPTDRPRTLAQDPRGAASTFSL